MIVSLIQTISLGQNVTSVSLGRMFSGGTLLRGHKVENQDSGLRQK